MTIGEVMKHAEALADYISAAPAPDLPSAAMVEIWRMNLRHPANEELVDYLRDHRGLTDETIRLCGVGWNDVRKRYSLPVRNTAGGLVAMRYYASEPDHGEPKMLMTTGSPVSLYPIADGLPPAPSGRPGVIVCEGEWDCLLLRQHGWNAITTTGGKGAWQPAWSALLAGHHVAYVYDVGAEDDALAHARQVQSSGAASVRVVHLPLPFEGDDITDWFTVYDRDASELRELITSSSPLGSGVGLVS